MSTVRTRSFPSFLRIARAWPRAVLALTLLCPAAAGVSLSGASDAPMRPYQRLIEEVAARHGLDAELFGALVDVESARKAGAISGAGAQGLAQLMPATAERFHVVDPHNPEDNLDGAARYLVWLLERFGGREDLALAGYNAGEGAVDRHGGIPPFQETRKFVRDVLVRAGRRVPEEPGPGRDASVPAPVRMVVRPDGKRILTNVTDESR